MSLAPRALLACALLLPLSAPAAEADAPPAAERPAPPRARARRPPPAVLVIPLGVPVLLPLTLPTATPRTRDPEAHREPARDAPAPARETP